MILLKCQKSSSKSSLFNKISMLYPLSHVYLLSLSGYQIMILMVCQTMSVMLFVVLVVVFCVYYYYCEILLK